MQDSVSSNRYPPNILEYPGSGVGEASALIKEEYVDIRHLFSAILRNKYQIILPSLIFAIAAYMLVSSLDPVYRATSRVMFGIESSNLADLQDLLTSPDLNSDELENEVQILYSSNLIMRVVRDLGLENDPEFNPYLIELEAEQQGAGFGVTAWIGDRLSGFRNLFRPKDSLESAESDPDSAVTAETLKLSSAVEAIKKDLKVTPIPDSTVIEISFSSYSPKLSSDVVNAISNQYIVDQLQVKLETANAATEWLTGRVEEFREKVKVSEEAVETLRASLSSDAGQGLEITQEQLAALNASLSDARSDATSLEARFLRLTEALKTGGSLGTESQLLRDYREDEADLLARKNALSESHPAVPRLDAQLRELRERIREEAERVLGTVEIELDSAQSRVRELERSVREMETKALAQSKEEIKIRLLEREAQANRLLYENLLLRLNETSEQGDLQRANARVLSAAEVPLQPESRNEAAIAIMAGMFGALAGLAFVLVGDSLNNTFRSPRKIEEMAGQPVLAVLPTVSVGENRHDLVRQFVDNSRSTLGESIRNLRTRILFSTAKLAPRVVTFTSSVPEEGKSTTSMLVAISSQQMGKSTIFLDCDLRLPSASKFFSIPQHKKGLLSVLDGTAQMEDAIFHDGETGLDILTVTNSEVSPTSEKNAADILSSAEFRQLVQRLSERYDLVIVDTPPVLIVTDACLISPLSDAVVYVVRWGKTPRDAVMEGLKELKRVGSPLIGTAVTLVNESEAAKFAFDGYTLHRGRYSSYYTN